MSKVAKSGTKGFLSFDVRCFGPNQHFFDFLVSFCRLGLGLCAKTVFNKIRCTAASAERIFAVQRRKLETLCSTKKGDL